jgi:hypothetical protein
MGEHDPRKEIDQVNVTVTVFHPAPGKKLRIGAEPESLRPYCKKESSLALPGWQ